MLRNPGLTVIVVFVGIIAPLVGARAQQEGFGLLSELQSKNITPHCAGYPGDQRFPDITSDGKGNFAVVWEDTRNGHADVYLQCYARDKKIQANQKVNLEPVWDLCIADRDAGSPHGAWPVVDVNANGAGVIVWRQNRTELHACLFDLATATIGNEITVYAGREGSCADILSVQVFSDASFIVGWRAGSEHMEYRLFSAAGTALTDVHSLDGSGLVESYSSPILALPDDRTAAVLSGDSASVFLEVIEQDGERRTERMEVFPPDPEIWDHSHGSPSAMVNGSGQVLVARKLGVRDDGNGRNFIQWRIVDCRGGAATPVQSIEVVYGHDLQALRDTGTGFQLYWLDAEPEHTIARIDGAGMLRDIRRFDHTIPGPARWRIGEACLLHDPVSGMLAVWTVTSSESFTTRSTHIRLTRTDRDTQGIEDLGIISDDTCGTMEVQPALFSNDAGRYLACWRSAPAGISMLHCQVLDEQLEAVGPVLTPNLETETEFSGILDATATPDGDFLLVYRGVNPKERGVLYLVHIDSDGEIRRKSVRLDDSTYSSLPLAIACSEDGLVNVGYVDIEDARSGSSVTLVRLSWQENAGPATAKRDSWPFLWFERTIAAIDVNARGDLLHASYRHVYDGGMYIKDLRAVVYRADGSVDTAFTLPRSARLDNGNDWYLLDCAINAERDIALCWTEIRYFGDRCSGADQWYNEPSLQLLRAHAETGWNPWLESFPLRTDDIPAVTLQWPDDGGLLCSWSVADSCKAVRYDDPSRRRETMAFHLSSPAELPALDRHRAHSVVIEGRQVRFLFESNDEAGQGYDIHGKVLVFGDDGNDRPAAFFFDMFPSPATRNATARFVLPAPSRVVVRVFDLLGRELRRRDAGILDEGGHFLAIPIEGLAAGTYLVGLSVPESHFRSMVILP